MHPSDDLRSSLSTRLKGKLVIMGITGSIAAVECVKLSRELIRHGARVKGVLTPEAQKIVHPYAVQFATGEMPVTELTGEVEHVSLCGDVPDRADLLLIAPCTANTLGKIVAGIDDTPVTTFATTALGTGIPVMIVPAMHGTMYDHSVVKENLKKAEELEIGIIGPMLEEKKAKMAGRDEIVDSVIRRIGDGRLSGKKVLIITGATNENIDDFRIVTNRATGRSGISLASEAFREGGDVLILAGERVCGIPQHIDVRRFSNVESLLEEVKKLDKNWGKPDIAFFTAAISDYRPVPIEGKIPSTQKSITVKMVRTPKVIEVFNDLFPSTFLVGYKAETVADDIEMMKRAYRRMKEVGMDLVVANRLKEVGISHSRVVVIGPDREGLEIEGSKEMIAGHLLDQVISRLGSKKDRGR